MPNAAGLFSSVTYRALRHTDSEGSSFYLDGSVIFTEESDEEMRDDLVMTLEIQDGFDAGVARAEAELSATCRMQDEISASCTLEAGSAAQFEGFGGFTIEGTHVMMGSELGGNGNAADVTAHGEDSVHIEYDVETECMQSCPEE